MQATQQKYPSIDEFLNSDYRTKVSVLPRKVNMGETNAFVTWKSGMVGIKARAYIMYCNFFFVGHKNLHQSVH